MEDGYKEDGKKIDFNLTSLNFKFKYLIFMFSKYGTLIMAIKSGMGQVRMTSKFD